MDHVDKAKVRSTVGLMVDAGWFMDAVNAIGVVRMSTLNAARTLRDLHPLRPSCFSKIILGNQQVALLSDTW